MPDAGWVAAAAAGTLAAAYLYVRLTPASISMENGVASDYDPDENVLDGGVSYGDGTDGFNADGRTDMISDDPQDGVVGL